MPGVVAGKGVGGKPFNNNRTLFKDAITFDPSDKLSVDIEMGVSVP